MKPWLTSIEFDGGSVVTTLRKFKDFYYIGTRNVETGAHLVRTKDFKSLQIITDTGFDNTDNIDFYGLTAFNSCLYIGTYNRKGAEIFRSADGFNFEMVQTKGGDDPSNIDFYSFIEFQGHLFSGTCNLELLQEKDERNWPKYIPARGAAIYKSSDGVQWVQVYRVSNNQHYFVRCFEEHQDCLYASVGRNGWPCTLLKSLDGSKWQEVHLPNLRNYHDCPIIVSFLGNLICFLGNKSNKVPFKVCEYDNEMKDLDNDGFGNKNNVAVMSAKTINNQLYVTTRNYVEGLEVWKTFDGVEWIKVSCNNPKYENCYYSLEEYQGHLVVGASDGMSRCSTLLIEL